MTALATRSGLVGVQTPRLRWAPPYARTSGPEVVELAAQAGLILDPWQRAVLADGMAEDEDGRWTCFECCVIVSRQNGKGAIFEARVLAGLFLLEEELILYSAHEFKTAMEMFLRIRSLIEGYAPFRRRVRKVITANGEEGIELLSGQRLRFIARSRSSGRGFGSDLNILDEAFKLGPTEMAALLPTMSARPNPQLWYGSSAGFEDSYQLGSVRSRGIAGGDPSLYFAEWSIPDEIVQQLEGLSVRQAKEVLSNPGLLAMSNPGLGYRLTQDFAAKEIRSLDLESLLRERFGVGTYPADEAEWTVIPEEIWRAREDATSRIAGRKAFGLDVMPDRSMGAISAAGRRGDGLVHGEVIDHRRGTGWMVGRMVELAERHDPVAIVLDAAGPAGNLQPELEEAGLEITVLTTREVGQAYTTLYDLIMQDRFRHIGQEQLDAAVAGATTRTIGDGAQAWDRRNATVDLCTLVSMTEGVWALLINPESDPLDNIW